MKHIVSMTSVREHPIFHSLIRSYCLAGLTYAAIGTLWFLSKLPLDPDRSRPLPDIDGISLEDCVRWMLSRQTTYLEEEEEDEDDDSGEDDSDAEEESHLEDGCIETQPPPTNKMQKLEVKDEERAFEIPPVLELISEDLKFAGFAGRLNKIADTCYCFWNTGALKVCIS